MDGALIYLHVHGQLRGPLPLAAVQQAYQQGEHAGNVMSWRPGEPRWRSLAARWASRRSRSGAAPALLLCVSMLALGCVFGVAAPLGLDRPFGLWLRDAPLQSAGSAIAMLLAAAALAWRVWRRRGERQGGSVLLGLAWLAVATCVGAALWQSWRFEATRHADGDARMHASADGRVLRIDGPIGPRFVPDLERALARSPAPRRIDIDSPGGLVMDALDAAALVAERGIPVRVTGRCASACTLLWAGAPRREIEVLGRIGLHQARIDGNLPKAWKASGLAEGEPRSLALLRAAGFGPVLLGLRARTPPEQVAWASAQALLDDGVSARVVGARGERASAAELAMADAMVRAHADADSAAMYVAYAGIAPRSGLEQAQRLQHALTVADDVELQREVHEATQALHYLAFDAADDGALRDWGRVVHAQLLRAVRARDVPACAAYVAGLEATPDPAQARVRKRALVALLEGIAPQRSARKSDLMHGLDLLERLQTPFRALVDKGYPEDFAHWNDLQQCQLVEAKYAYALALAPGDDAQALRLIEGVL